MDLTEAWGGNSSGLAASSNCVGAFRALSASVSVSQYGLRFVVLISGSGPRRLKHLLSPGLCILKSASVSCRGGKRRKEKKRHHEVFSARISFSFLILFDR